jgi:hypothetical protein
MRKTRLALFGALALSLVAISTPAAQQSNNNNRKPPKHTPDKGIDDPEPAAAEPLTIGERNASGAVVITRDDGSVVALLDESFHDALVATRNADGTLSYTCLHGLPAGAKHVGAPMAPVSKTPILEEK